MLKSFIKISLRNYIKNKSNTFINIVGLSLGITCSLIIFLIIKFEYSFNTNIKESNKIYRIVSERNEYGQLKHYSGIQYPLPAAFKNDFGSSIDKITFTDAGLEEPLVTVKNKGNVISKFKEKESCAFVDPDYFEMFSYEWISGDKKNAVTRPFTAVLSETLAKKYFGGTDVLGKTLNINNEMEIEITGVVKDPPLNSDFPFHMILAMQGSGRIDEDWGSVSSDVQCFVKLKGSISPAQLSAFIQKYRPNKKNQEVLLKLQPLTEMHLDDRYVIFKEAAVTKESLWALGCIGIFLIIMACINYINLNTAVAIKRAKEVGIRKVLGGNRTQVVFNFVLETALLVISSILISLALSELCLEQLINIFGYKLSLTMFDSLELAGFLTALFLVVTILAGLYPSLYLSCFKSLEAVRTRTFTSDKNSFLRKSLVVVQFSIAHIIIIGTLIVISQIDYFRNKNLGFNKDAIVEVSLPTNQKDKIESFKNKLAAIPSVLNYSCNSTGAASNSLWTSNFIYNSRKNQIEDRTETKFADSKFFDTYGIELIAGNTLPESDTVTRLVINEAFVKAMGLGKNYQAAIGKIVRLHRKDLVIDGVIKDFNSLALHEAISPMLITTLTSEYYQAGIKINTEDIKTTLSQIEKAWSDVYPEYVYEYKFLDETIKEFYEREERTSAILNIFSFIAILISCLGLFGLAAYSITTKTKEIGIRKVLGASLLNILTLITSDFFKLIILGFVLSVPVAYYLMNLWLDDFAYKISIGPGVFIIAVVFTSIVALVTVGYMSLKAATANPVKSLKYE